MLVNRHLGAEEVAIAESTWLSEMSLLNVLFLLVYVDEFSTFPALPNVSATVRIMAMHLSLRELPSAVLAA